MTQQERGSGVTVSNDDARLARADLLVHSSNPQERSEGEVILADLSSSLQTDIAIRAQSMLSRVLPQAPLWHDEAVDQMMNVWSMLRSPLQEGPLDGRFAGWFAEAEAQPGTLQRFAARMRDSVNGWLAEYERLIEQDFGASQATVFDQWSSIAAHYPSVAETLRKELDAGRALRSRRLLALRRKDVEEALLRGDIPSAWTSFSEIESLQHLPNEDVVMVRDAIYRIAGLRAKIERWRTYLPVAPRSRGDIERIREVVRRGQTMMQEEDAPSAWLSEIRGDLGRLAEMVAAFVRDRVAACHTLEEFREVIEELDAGNASDTSDDWLEPLETSILGVLAREVTGAHDPAALRCLIHTATELAVALPAGSRERLRAELARLEAVATRWDRVESGPSAGGASAEAMDGTLPSHLKEVIGHFALLAQSVEDARRHIHFQGPTVLRIEASEEAIEMLAEIIRQAPDYAAANELLQTARSHIDHLRLDESIERWDLKALRSAASRETVWEAPYRQLLEQLDVLEQLAELRAMLSEGSDLQSIAIWWSLWRDTETRLPEWKPDSLKQMLDAARSQLVVWLSGAVEEYLRRSTTLEEDRVTEATVVPVAGKLRLDEVVTALKRRREIHELVDEAQHAGIGRLATVLREQWGLISRALPQPMEILFEALERAWDEVNYESLDALREVARRALTHASDPRLTEWLDWLVIEDALSGEASPEGIAALRSYLQSHPKNAVLRRRMERLIRLWRERNDLPAQVWAYRIFNDVEPPLMPGSDPLQELAATTEAATASVREACRVAESVDASFVEMHRQELKAAADRWDRLEHLLLSAAPRSGAEDWPNRPAVLREATALLSSIHEAIGGIASLSQIDLRSAGERWDRIDRLVRLQLASFPFSERMRQSLRRAEPLTKLAFLERQFRYACEKCGSQAARDRERTGAFEHAARCLEEIAEVFRGTEPEGMHTWEVAGREYWRDVPRMAGDLLSVPSDTTVHVLVSRLKELDANEHLFRSALERLWAERPAVGSSGAFDPLAHRAYLRLCPEEPPLSVRVWAMFRDLAEKQPLPVVLRKSREYLPEWVSHYLDRAAKGLQPW